MPVNFYKDQIHSPAMDYKPAPVVAVRKRKANKTKNKNHQATNQTAKSVLATTQETPATMSKRKAKRQRQANNKLQRTASAAAQLTLVDKTTASKNQGTMFIPSEVVIPKVVAAQEAQELIFDPEASHSQEAISSANVRVIVAQEITSRPEESRTSRLKHSPLYKGARCCTRVTDAVIYPVTVGVNICTGLPRFAQSWKAVPLYTLYGFGTVSNYLETNPSTASSVARGFTNSVNSLGQFAWSQVDNLGAVLMGGGKIWLNNPLEVTRLGITAAAMGTGLYYTFSNFVKAIDTENRCSKGVYTALAAANLAATVTVPYVMYSTSATYPGMAAASLAIPNLYLASASLAKAVEAKSFITKITHGSLALAAAGVAAMIPTLYIQYG